MPNLGVLCRHYCSIFAMNKLDKVAVQIIESVSRKV